MQLRQMFRSSVLCPEEQGKGTPGTGVTLGNVQAGGTRIYLRKNHSISLCQDNLSKTQVTACHVLPCSPPPVGSHSRQGVALRPAPWGLAPQTPSALPVCPRPTIHSPLTAPHPGPWSEKSVAAPVWFGSGLLSPAPEQYIQLSI